MSEDLIRRSDAIDAIENTDWYRQNHNKDMVSGANSSEHQAWYKADDVYKALEAIPTIEPKREEWADIIGYEGLYQVSNEARVRNQKGEILKQYIKRGRSTCYKAVKLYKDGRYKTKYIHRIMAECFIPNPGNLPMINHIDEDGTNNRLDNLEWCTVKYNSNYSNAKKNMSKGKRKRLTADMRGKDDE